MHKVSEQEIHHMNETLSETEVPAQAQSTFNETSIKTNRDSSIDKTEKKDHNVETYDDEYSNEELEKSEKTKRSTMFDHTRRIKRIKRKSEEKNEVAVVKGVNFFIDRDFMNELVESCR